MGWTDPVWPDCGPPLAPLSGPRGRQGWRGLRDQLHVLEKKNHYFDLNLVVGLRNADI